MPDDQLAAVLEDCVRALRAGATREECLRAYPRLRGQLAPLLEGASRCRRKPSPLSQPRAVRALAPR